MGRVVEQGVLRAPQLAPIDVTERMREQSGENYVPVRPQDLEEALASGARLISVDAATDADLDRIVSGADFSLRTDFSRCAAEGRRVMWAGAAGLAKALASRIGGVQTTPPVAARGKVLFCLGSDHAVTLEQQSALLSERPSTIAGVLRIPRGCINAAELIAENKPAALVVSGGDTASLVFRAIGACTIDLHAEIVPGVPYGILRGGIFDGIPVVTKSGGFGDRDTLVNVADFFHAPI